MRPPWEELEPASRSAVERQRLATRRVDLAATVVFAAAMALQALIIIDHTVTAVPDRLTIGDMFLSIWQALSSGGIGFLVLLACWLLHHLQFHYLTRSSGSLLLAHAFLLPSALLVPLSTALLHSAGLSSHTALLLSCHVLTIQVLLLLIWRHAVRGGLLFGSDVPPRIVVRVKLLLRISVFAMALASGLSLASAVIGLGTLVAILTAQIALVARGGYTLELKRETVRTTGR